jgi:hypothetical protein
MKIPEIAGEKLMQEKLFKYFDEKRKLCTKKI